MGDPGLGLRRSEEEGEEGTTAISESGIQGTGPTCGSLKERYMPPPPAHAPSVSSKSQCHDTKLHATDPLIWLQQTASQ